MVSSGLLLTAVLLASAEAISVRPLTIASGGASAGPALEEPRRPWHPRLALVAKADGSMRLERKEAAPTMMQSAPSLLQVQSSGSADSCNCAQQPPPVNQIGHGPNVEAPFATGSMAYAAVPATVPDIDSMLSKPPSPMPISAAQLPQVSGPATQSAPATLPQSFLATAGGGQTEQLPATIAQLALSATSGSIGVQPPPQALLQQEQQRDNEIRQLQMLSTARQQEFSAMRAMESNLARQQGQLQMEMVQMERQVEQLGQTSQREEALLQAAQARQAVSQQRAVPFGTQPFQNMAMSSQPWNSQFLSQPQLQGQQWAPVTQMAAFPQAMQAPLPQPQQVAMMPTPQAFMQQQAALQQPPGNLVTPQQAAMIQQASMPQPMSSQQMLVQSPQQAMWQQPFPMLA